VVAEGWVGNPEEARPRAALEIGTSGSTKVPTTWLARAAGYSGGSLTPEDSSPARASPDATAINLKAAVIMALVHRPMSEIPAWTKACVEAGIRFAEGGDAKVLAPTFPAAKSGAA
jgi:hypothetical protein